MTKIHLYSLASPLHSEVIPSPADDRFIKDILSCGGVEFIFHNDFSTWGTFPSGREVTSSSPEASATSSSPDGSAASPSPGDSAAPDSPGREVTSPSPDASATSSSPDGSAASPSPGDSAAPDSPGREVLYIRTGGTEGLFLQTFFQISPRAPLGRNDKGAVLSSSAVIPSEARESPSSVISTERQRAEKSHFTLLTSGESNSLAASMEILSFLRLRGLSGEIIHGTPASVAARLASLALPSTPFPSSKISPRAPLGRNDKGAVLSSSSAVISSEVEKSLLVEGAERLLEGVRLGVVGRPSDWLISSDVDYAKARERFGVEIIDISMDELLDEIRVGGFSIPDAIRLNSLNTPKYGVPFKAGDFDKALEIYGALSRIVRKHSLQGLTLRCFDLLGTVGSTGCMALAILNAEGITATCEGDVPAMVTMAIAKKIAGTPGFQVNLSRIREEGFLFAHCTVPLNIVDNYCYDTHFESGIGVAVHGEFSKGPVTIFKVGASMDRFFLAPAILVDNPYANNLCRTQVLLRPAAPAGQSPSRLAPAAEASVSVAGSSAADASASVAGVAALADYFLREPLGNHHVILPGDWVSAIRKNLAWRP